MKQYLLRALVAVLIGLALNALATITVVDYWRMGENDPVAGPGIMYSTTDSVGPRTLATSGQPYYLGNVSPAAAAYTGSTLSFWNSSSVTSTNGAYAYGAVIPDLVDNFGIECWVNPDNTTGSRCIVYNGDPGANGWGLYQAGSACQVLYGGVNFVGSATFTPGAWVHLALVRNKGVTSLYVNGSLVSFSSAFTPNPPSGAFAVGAPPPRFDTEFFSGYVDEVRVFTFVGSQFSPNDLLINQNNFKLGVTNLLEGPSAGSDSVEMVDVFGTGSWSAAANAAWLHLNTNGTGNAIVAFSYDANPGTASRAATLSIAGQQVLVTQAGSNYVAAGATTLVSSGLFHPSGLAVDGSGNLYFTDSFLNTVKEWNAASQTVSFLAYSGLNGPQGVAADRMGNVFFCDGTNTVKECLAGSHTVNTLIASGLTAPYALVLDGSGNLFIADSESLQEWVAATGSLNHFLNIPVLVGLVVDTLDNLYAAFPFRGTFIIAEITTGGFGPLGATITASTNTPGVAVDGGGNLLFTDGSLLREWNKTSQAVSTRVSLGSNTYATYLAVDVADNVYFIDQTSNRIMEAPRAFVNPAPRYESALAGSDALPAILPATFNLTGPFFPTSDQPWLTINGVTNGAAWFSFTANTSGSNRVAHINLLGVQVSVNQSATAPWVTHIKNLGNGILQISFTNNPNATFSVRTSTNLALPLAEWAVAGTATDVGAGVFQFVAPLSTVSGQHFYRVSSP